MNSKRIKIPGPDHPITITPTKGRVTVTVNGKRVADTHEALTLKEAAYPGVQYIPRKDVDMMQLQRTSHQTYCPYKGECAYYSIPAGGERSVNAVWTYEAPYAAVSAIREWLTVRRAGVTFDVLVVPGIPASGSKRRERLFLPSYRTSCVRVRWYMPALRLLAVGGLVLVALCLWSKVKGASTRPVLLGSTAWAIGTSAALGQSLLLCRLTGGWTFGMPLVALITGNAVFLGLATPFVLRSYQAATAHRERAWHETARIGAIYMIGANLAALIMVMVMTSILPAIPSGHSLISGGLRLLDVGMNAVLLFLIGAVLIGPIAEEVMFRGILLPWLDSWLPERAGLAILSAQRRARRP